MNVMKVYNSVLSGIVATAKHAKRGGQRCLSTNVSENVSQVQPNDRECVEVQIPMPWGFLRGKWWGPTDKRPILGLHGWQVCKNFVQNFAF